MHYLVNIGKEYTNWHKKVRFNALFIAIIDFVVLLHEKEPYDAL
jgi:hypothetical protein